MLKRFGIDVTRREVNIGLSSGLSLHDRHGLVHLRTTDGKFATCAFQADKPEHLVNPSASTVETLFDQVEKMGMAMDGIEIKLQGSLRVYRRNDAGVIELKYAGPVH